MSVLKTPRADVPAEIIEHLDLIKTVFMELNPDIPDAPLVTMLNAALEPRYRGTSYRETARQLHDGDVGQQIRIKKAVFTRKMERLCPTRFEPKAGRAEFLNALCMPILLEDGLHPMATLTGFHVMPGQSVDLDQRKIEGNGDFQTFALNAQMRKCSPLVNPAIVVMDDPWHSAFFDQKSIVDHLARFAHLLANKRDLLSHAWELGFAPKGSRFERNKLKVTTLMLAIGAITETLTHLAGDRIAGADWPWIQKHQWATNGYVAELGEQTNPALFLEETLKHPAQINPRALPGLHRIENHPLKHPLTEAFAKHQVGKNAWISDDEKRLVCALVPELGPHFGLSYEAIVSGLYNNLILKADIETIDWALGSLSRRWGRPVPSQDVELIDSKMPKHEQWIDANQGQLSEVIERCYQQGGAFPEALTSGKIPPALVPNSLTEEFARHQMQKVMSTETAQYIRDLRASERIDASFVIDALTTTGKSLSQSRLSRAYHQKVVTLDEISRIKPSGLDSVFRADLGL